LPAVRWLTIPATNCGNGGGCKSVHENTTLSARGLHRFREAVGQAPFRGTLIDNCAAAPMGKGHGNRGLPFDINTACYLKPAVAAYHQPHVRKIVIMAGVKTLKSFFVEMAAAHYLCHAPGDTGIFFGTAETADDVSTTRILSYFDGIESYKAKKATIIGQWDYTMSAVKFPDKTFWLKPANLANAQQKNLGFVGVQDAFVCGNNGMIDQLIERTTQYADDKKIVIESQGGETGFDFDRHYADTDQGELGVICPHCRRNHVFNWKVFDEGHMKRPEDFVPTPPLIIPSLDHNAWVEHHRPLLLGKTAGFQRGDDELIKFADGSYNEAAILRETHFECYHCGGVWRDDGEFGPTRIALDESSHYVSANPQALPENVGFNFPQWINRRLPWGKIMLEKLKRQKIAKESGNYEPLKQWFQKFAGRTWDNQYQFRKEISISPGSYDPNQVMPDEESRDMAVDCQQDQDHMDRTGNSVTGWFWYVARVYDRAGNSRQLARGYCKSWEEWQAVQKHWKIPNDRVVIDIDQWPTQIYQKAAESREVIKIEKPMPPFFLREKTVTWYLLAAENKIPNFKHKDGQPRPWSPEQPVPVPLFDAQGRRRTIMLKKIRFNKKTFQLQLDAIRSGAPGMPKFEFLDRAHLLKPDGTPDTLTQEMETGNRTYDKQMNAQYYDPVKDKYEELRPDDHYSWCEQALLVRQAMDGKFGHLTVFGG
jgi:Phage terminase large subunit (GpA)